MQVGVSCVRGLVKHADCRACVQDPLHPCELTPDVLEMVRENPNHRHADPDSYSPSYLLGCDRQASLQSDHDWYVDVNDAWAMVRGTMIHAATEKLPYPGVLQVIREMDMVTEVETQYGPKLFYAKPDLIVLKRLEDGIVYAKIVDYKSKNEIGHDLTEVPVDHVRQINMYRWIVERELTLTQFGEPQDYPVIVDELEMFYGDMKKSRRFTSAGPLKTRGKLIQRAPRKYAEITLAPITIYDAEVVGRWITRRIEEKYRAVHEELAPVLEGDEAWKCAKCPVRETCFAIAAGVSL